MSKERIFSESDLIEILANAEALQKLDSLREDKKLIEDAKKELLIYDRGLNETDIYDIGRELNVPANYVQKALALKYIPPEKQIEDLKNHNGIPTQNLIKRVCNRELLGSLRKFSPLEEFDIMGFYPFIFVRVEEQEKKRLIGRPKKIEIQHRLAEYIFTYLKNGGIGYEFTLKDPLFLRACGNTLKELKDRFGGLFNCEIKHDYEI